MGDVVEFFKDKEFVMFDILVFVVGVMYCG